MINLTNARLMRGEHVLLESASLTIHKGQKAGIIGRNGAGKSSLFACLTGQVALDEGELQMPEGLRCAWMKQETLGSDCSALDHVIDGDSQFRQIELALEKAEADHDGHEIARLHNELDKIDGYSVRVRAEQLLSGLGFKTEEFDNPVGSFSGGWRIRLNLAAALMSPSDLLLLDEPTNHLDLEATIWLEQWLNRYPGTLLLISHDRSFLDKVIDHVISFEQKDLFMYRGNFSAYEIQRAERLAQQQAALEKQQRRKAEIEDFVRRFRAKASKARQAQSRLKELARMQDIAPAHIDSPFRFEFFKPSQTASDLLSIKKAVIGYDNKPLVKNISLKLMDNSSIGLLGFNGMGKSTLLKTLAGQLPWLGGEIVASKHLKVGYFAQHQVDVMDMRASPMQLIQQVDEKVREQEVRNFLGGFDFRGDRVVEPIINFSGGEKARLALALIVWQKPNVLLLDEPTNHLDLEMRHALTVALQGFEGAMVLVSHDRHLMANTVDEFYTVHDGRFAEFSGDLDDYSNWLREADKQSAPPSGASAGADNNAGSTPEKPAADKKDARRQAALQREQVAPLKREIRTLEKTIDKLSTELQTLENRLADPDIYTDSRKDELAELIRQQGYCKAELSQAEDTWLEKSALLEQ
ncbi:ATP-binding cassette domain-containing protein [Pseudohongiella spirulinae]|uniref:Probable ATP-binding protein YheS n=1 Tax=Pseudohongiella spirulinae TaxID=1249552 RepID=A0A0S2KAU0_9GAMM|nr:ATP-binding cassette domain-containing protein [Pseudohongiella spirulinae]ALO45172.1 putative ATP-binding component of ABC transporter [Pseudohongiella spirulinae]